MAGNNNEYLTTEDENTHHRSTSTDGETEYYEDAESLPSSGRRRGPSISNAADYSSSSPESRSSTESTSSNLAANTDHAADTDGNFSRLTEADLIEPQNRTTPDNEQSAADEQTAVGDHLPIDGDHGADGGTDVSSNTISWFSTASNMTIRPHLDPQPPSARGESTIQSNDSINHLNTYGNMRRSVSFVAAAAADYETISEDFQEDAVSSILVRNSRRRRRRLRRAPSQSSFNPLICGINDPDPNLNSDDSAIEDFGPTVHRTHISTTPENHLEFNLFGQLFSLYLFVFVIVVATMTYKFLYRYICKNADNLDRCSTDLQFGLVMIFSLSLPLSAYFEYKAKTRLLAIKRCREMRQLC